MCDNSLQFAIETIVSVTSIPLTALLGWYLWLRQQKHAAEDSEARIVKSMLCEFEYNLELVNDWLSTISKYRELIMNCRNTKPERLDFGILRLHIDKLYIEGMLFKYLRPEQIKRLQSFLLWTATVWNRNDAQNIIAVLTSPEQKDDPKDTDASIVPRDRKVELLDYYEDTITGYKHDLEDVRRSIKDVKLNEEK